MRRFKTKSLQVERLAGFFIALLNTFYEVTLKIQKVTLQNKRTNTPLNMPSQLPSSRLDL
jgi:hypothetical protein